MNQNPILPDDPRLTAYALGEMSADERREFEHLLAQDPAARQTIVAISETAAALSTALEQEGKPDMAKAAIVAGRDPRKLDGGPLRGLPKVISFPYWQISGLAAACFAVFFVYWQTQQPEPVAMKRYVEVPLGPPAPSGPQSEPAEKAADQLAVGLTAESQAVTPLRDKNEITFSVPAAEARPAPEALAQSFRSNSKGGKPGGAAAQKLKMGYVEASRVTLGGVAPQSLSASAEAYAYRKDSDYQRVTDQPLSTFSVDVDTASYANVRRMLVAGQRPPMDAVRIEELINYFPYDYAGPTAKTEAPFAANLEVASAPWAPEHRLVRIGLKGREVSEATRPQANLVFLVDVSGSMNRPNKLPLLKQSLRLLVERLRPDDRVAIAVYAGSSGLALPSTPASHKAEILDAIEQLQAGGSTNGALGIHLAYDIAKANFVPGGVNRVLLATDGDFNVGVTSEGELVRLVQEKAKSGVFLSVLGLGTGNLKDSTMEQLADKGNGNYAYLDTLQEAKKTLVEQAGGTLVTIAKDVKIQVEFNPAQVAAYRLIGYENRLLAKEDFNNDAVDAGEIGAGHTVTALYEIVPVGAAMLAAGTVDELKYQKLEARSEERGAGSRNPEAGKKKLVNAELLTVKLRYKEPAGEVSHKLEFPLRDSGQAFAEASQDFKFAAAVAGFGMVLRDSPHRGRATLAEVAAWGRSGVGRDMGGYRTEFLGLVERAQSVVQ